MAAIQQEYEQKLDIAARRQRKLRSSRTPQLDKVTRQQKRTCPAKPYRKTRDDLRELLVDMPTVGDAAQAWKEASSAAGTTCSKDFDSDEATRVATDGSEDGGEDNESDTADVGMVTHPIHSLNAVVPQSVQEDDASLFAQMSLTPEEAARVASELLKISVSYDKDMDKFEELAAAALNRSNGRLVQFMRRKSGTAAAIRIQGFDFGALFPTAEERCSHKTHIPAAVACGLARLLGFGVVGYKAEKIYTHPFFHDIRPVRGGNEGHNGAGEPLNFHMDMSYEFEKAPEWLVLVCLREGVDPNVKTPFLQNRALYMRLVEHYPEDIVILKDPTSYKIQQPISAGGGFVEEMPLLTGDNEDEAIFWLRVNHDRIVPQNKEAETAFRHLQSLMGEIADDSIHLVAGDVFLVNNMKCLHTRTEFKAAFNGEDRLLVRSYFKDKSKLPEGRIF